MSGGTDTTDLARLLAEATPGPWRVDYRDDDDDMVIVGRPSWYCTRYGVRGEWEVAKMELPDEDGQADLRVNAALIVALRNAAPDLLATITRLQAERDAAVARAEKAEAREGVLEKAVRAGISAADSFCDGDGDFVAGQVKLRLLPALDGGGVRS